jgi:hypothetical protein
MKMATESNRYKIDLCLLCLYSHTFGTWIVAHIRNDDFDRRVLRKAHIRNDDLIFGTHILGDVFYFEYLIPMSPM